MYFKYKILETRFYHQSFLGRWNAAATVCLMKCWVLHPPNQLKPPRWMGSWSVNVKHKVFTSDLMKSALIKYAVFWCGKSNDNIWGRSWKIALGDSNQWGWSHDQDAHGNFSIQETIDLPTSDGVFLQFFLEPILRTCNILQTPKIGFRVGSRNTKMAQQSSEHLEAGGWVLHMTSARIF